MSPHLGGQPVEGTDEAGTPEPVEQPLAPDQAETPDRPVGEGEPAAESEDPIDVLRRERDAYLELAQRTQAEFDNYRKRVARETAVALTRGKGELALAMLPAIDNLERALIAAAEADRQRAERRADAGNADGATNGALSRGVALVYDDLRSTLERAGVEPFDPTGEAFDPATSEAIATHPDPSVKPGVVLETADRGWRLNGQVLRPARVVVSE